MLHGQLVLVKEMFEDVDERQFESKPEFLDVRNFFNSVPDKQRFSEKLQNVLILS